MAEGESEPVYEAFLEISRMPYSETDKVVFYNSKYNQNKNNFIDRRDFWDFENKGIFLPPREREEIVAEARRRGANIVIQSQNGQYGRPYVFLKLDDEKFLDKVRGALKF